MRLPHRFFALLMAAAAPFSALAQVAAPAGAPSALTDPAPVHDLDAVVVTGSAPGPGLWHVYSGDNELWNFATLSPLPASINWNSKVLRDLIAESEEVLWQPYYSVDVKAGFFQKLSLGYNMTKAGKNPYGKTLEQVMSPELYARWSRAKARYLPNDRGVEERRPLLAAEDLYLAAIKSNGLASSRIWVTPINEVTKAAGVKSTAPKVLVNLSAEKAKAMLKEAQTVSFNDTACMVATLDAIEQDLPRMITNANAWATGDVDRISFTKIQRRDNTCSDVFSNNEVSRRYGLPNIALTVKDRFIQEAAAALKRNHSTVAVVPLSSVIGPNGYAARLRAMGYEVSSP